MIIIIFTIIFTVVISIICEYYCLLGWIQVGQYSLGDKLLSANQIHYLLSKLQTCSGSKLSYCNYNNYYNYVQILLL